ncbi:salicylate hydroxylase [Phlyctema vagabunda]|uniref:Salicylate hydroxylase n=1 Tax=Phlyctema vagabunda TaxID=108571 RepID=A0ABR4PKP2_9HELO
MDTKYLKDPPARIFTATPEDKTLEIGIIGAGIAGLAAAAGLLRSGHQVEIFERSSFANEVGAAICVCPNASRVLRYWGFDTAKAKTMCYCQGQIYAGDTLDVKYYGDYSHWPNKYGADAYFIHRVDLHSGLKDLAINAGPEYESAKINLTSEVVDLDCETGTITLVDGSSFRKDLVVVADGVHSRFVQNVTGHDTPAIATGHSAFRFMIPTVKLTESEILKPLFSDVPSGLSIATLGDRRLVWYPCRSGDLYNFAGIHAEEAGRTYDEEWNVTASLDTLLRTYGNFNPAIVEICRNAEDLKLWKLLFRTPLPTWTKDKVVLIGDAAHPMLPHQSQGAGQGIEDGAAIGALLSHIKSINEIPRRLRLFEEVRRNRASAIQIFSNVGQDEATKIDEAACPFIKGHIPL